MSSLRKEIARLRKQAAREKAELVDEALPAPEREYRKAVAVAQPDELAELADISERLTSDAPDPETEDGDRCYELWARLLTRTRSTLAGDVRLKRDGLWRELHRSSPGSQAETSRSHAIKFRRAPLINDRSEIAAIIAQIRGPEVRNLPTTEQPRRIMQLVGLVESEGD